ncbi:hypothetical protein [Chondrinema litorale]|uniref:hypothetical protein n=1 Tax=Chondrinema litorale TaxID=2994555 RepID=UPI0025434B42|nr:hypothetical protein [Chondrinema litorale]UZR97669.1 hypothetical protein OQ292_28090 [Chondrinema litorale]
MESINILTLEITEVDNTNLNPPYKAALLLGLIGSTFSTLFIIFGLGRIGENPLVDWMNIGVSYFDQSIISANLGWEVLMAGVFMHQTADMLWAFAFFGLLWFYTRKLTPLQILIVSIPWAVLAAAVEYYIVANWLQPLGSMPFWTAILVHVVSGSVYPVFPLIRKWMGHANLKYVNFAEEWSIVICVGMLAFGMLWAMGNYKLIVNNQFTNISKSRPEVEIVQGVTAQQSVSIDLLRKSIRQ